MDWWAMVASTKNRLKAFIFVMFTLITLLCSNKVMAGEKTQLHIRTGYLAGQYSGQFEGDFIVPSALDIDYEIFLLYLV